MATGILMGVFMGEHAGVLAFGSLAFSWAPAASGLVAHVCTVPVGPTKPDMDMVS